MAGNVHFAPGKSFQQGNMHVHDLVPFPDKNFDLSHTITKLTFGKGYPGQQNPLDGVFINQTTSTASQAATGMWQYFLKVCELPVSARAASNVNVNESCIKSIDVMHKAELS